MAFWASGWQILEGGDGGLSVEHPNGTPHGVSLSQCYSSPAPLKSAGMTYIVNDYPFIRPSLTLLSSIPLFCRGWEEQRANAPLPLQRADKNTIRLRWIPSPNTHHLFLLHMASSLTISNSLTPTLSVSSFPMFLTLSQSSLRGIKFFICCFLSLLSLHYLTLIFSPLTYFFALITFPLSSFLVFPSKFF